MFFCTRASVDIIAEEDHVFSTAHKAMRVFLWKHDIQFRAVYAKYANSQAVMLIDKGFKEEPNLESYLVTEPAFRSLHAE